MAPSSSSSRKWVYDIFPSYFEEDIDKNIIHRFFRKLNQELITFFKDYKTERRQSLDPELENAIRTSRIALVVLSKSYASSSWCLNELLEIMQCKEDLGQFVIPIFYDLDPSHLTKLSGVFGEAFKKTCESQSEQLKNQWKQALNDIASISGYHSKNWDNDARMLEAIASDVLGKLESTPYKNFDDFVGIKDHMTKIISLLALDSEEVRRVGIWGPSGIGKTTIARALFGLLSSRFESSIFIDKTPDDHSVKLCLQKKILSEILGKKHQKVLIFIDDLDNHLVLNALRCQTQRFGSGSRIIVVTNDIHLLWAHKVDCIYDVCFPSEKLALGMFCRYAFGKNYPPDHFRKRASEVVLCAGNLPLGLNVFGSYLRGKDEEGWIDMMSKLQNGLDEKIEKTLRVDYDGLNNRKDEAVFRYVACLLHGEKVKDIELLLADSYLDVNIGLRNLIDKSLVHVREDTVEMHRLLQEMGKEIVRAQSSEPGKREFLVDSKDICHVLQDNIFQGTENVLGIALDIDETDDLHIHESAFKGMSNLLFLKIYTKQNKEVRWHIPKVFDYFPPKVRLLSWENYPLRCLPSSFHPENLVKLEMKGSKLEKLWKGVLPLKGLKFMDLGESKNLRKIPDLSMAINLEILRLNNCSSLVELPSSIQHLNKLEELNMQFCLNLEILPTGINLQSLNRLNLCGCSRLRSFPDISTNISWLDLCKTGIEEIPSKSRLENLGYLFMVEIMSDKLWKGVQLLTSLLTWLSPSLSVLWLSDIPSLVELPSSFQNLSKLKELKIRNCMNLETLPTGMNLAYLDVLDLSGCSRLRSFPDISTNISQLLLGQTGIEEVPWWIENFSRLDCIHMNGCNNLKCVSINIYKLKHLATVDFSFCGALTTATWNDSPNAVATATQKLPVPSGASSSLPDDYVPKVELNLMNCFNLDQEVLYQKEAVFFKSMELSGKEVPSYFTHRTTGTSLTIPLLCTSPSQPLFRFRACAVVMSVPIAIGHHSLEIEVCCMLIDRLNNQFDLADWPLSFSTTILDCHLVIFDCCFPLKQDNASRAEFKYYQVNIQFRLMSDYPQLKIKECGIRLFDTEHYEECGDNTGGMSFSRNWV